MLKKGLSWLAVKCSLSRVVLSCCICLRQNRGGRGKKKKNTSCLRIVISFKAACGGSACFVSLWPKEGGLAFFLSFLPSLLPARGGAGQGRSVRPAARPSPSGCPPGSRPPGLRRQRPPSFPKNDNNNYYCCSLLLVKGRLRV